MPKNDGGPAYPSWTADMPGEGSWGMSLRDYFAGQALAHLYTQDEGNVTNVAEWAYVVADAMLAERDKEQ